MGVPFSRGRRAGRLNLTPDFVPCWKLPKVFPELVPPPVTVIAYPCFASAGEEPDTLHALPDPGCDWDHPVLLAEKLGRLANDVFTGDHV